ncbi:MAG: PEFG-CTERM sorting domain-containing protein [Nitrosarchaeum sp.]
MASIIKQFLFLSIVSVLIIITLAVDVVFAETVNIGISEDVKVPMGAIIVGTGSDKDTTVVGLSSDRKIRVEITASNPVQNSPMSITITFRDSNGGTIKQNVNYDIHVIQNDRPVLLDLSSYTKNGTGKHITSILASDELVNIEVTLLGFGSGDESQWSGPKGEVLIFHVVPEFGTIVMMILSVALVSIIGLTAKSRLSIRL